MKEFKISGTAIVICCVWMGEGHPYMVNTFTTRKKYSSYRQGGEKSIPALKMYILWNMVDSIPYLVPTQFQESIFPPGARLKILAQKFSISVQSKKFLPGETGGNWTHKLEDQGRG